MEISGFEQRINAFSFTHIECRWTAINLRNHESVTIYVCSERITSYNIPLTEDENILLAFVKMPLLCRCTNFVNFADWIILRTYIPNILYFHWNHVNTIVECYFTTAKYILTTWPLPERVEGNVRCNVVDGALTPDSLALELLADQTKLSRNDGQESVRDCNVPELDKLFILKITSQTALTHTGNFYVAIMKPLKFLEAVPTDKINNYKFPRCSNYVLVTSSQRFCWEIKRKATPYTDFYS